MQSIPPEVDLSGLDSILGPVLSMTSLDSSAEPRVLALLSKGFNPEVQLSPEAIRQWILSRCVDGYMFGSSSDSIGGRHEADEQRGPTRSRRNRDVASEMRGLAKSPEGWGQLVDSARARAISSSVDGRDVRGDSLEIMQRVVAGVLLELPATRRRAGSDQQGSDEQGDDDRVLLSRNVGARAALTAIGLMALADGNGWDSVLLSQQRLGVELGVHWQTAKGYLDLLVDFDLLTNPRSRRFIASRYRIKKLRGQRLGFARELDQVATELVDGQDGRVATVLRSVTHPAWTYSAKLKLKHWAVLLADTADVDPGVFGFSLKEARACRRTLRSEYDLVPGVVVPYLTEILDRLADDPEYGLVDKATGARVPARDARARAMAEYEELKAANKAAAEAATRQKRDGYAALAAVLQLHPIPKTPFDQRLSPKTKDRREQDVVTWIHAVHRLILAEAPNETARKVVGALLTKRLMKERYVSAFASGVVSFIMHAGEGTSLEDWMLLGDDALRSVVAGEVPLGRAVAGARPNAV